MTDPSLSHKFRDFENEKLKPEELTLYSASLSLEINNLLNHKAESTKRIDKILQSFYSENNNFANPLSNDLLINTIKEIRTARQYVFRKKPEITYIVPIYNSNEKKLFSTLNSIHRQIGVTASVIAIIDGLQQKDYEKIINLQLNPEQASNTLILKKERNCGVAKARNTGMKAIKTEFFSWLDAHDLIHPLRSIHSILSIYNTNIDRLNTGCARVNLDSKKIFLKNHKASMIGHTSFVAKTKLLKKMGYLLDLKKHEDTEYEQRLRFFNIPMEDSEIVGHYLDLELNSQRGEHLSGDTWEKREIINDHSAIQGTYNTSITDERKALNAETLDQYIKAQEEMANKNFPCLE